MQKVRIFLQHKVLIGYIALLTVIISIATILIYERIQLKELENELKMIQRIQRDINTAHRRITTLATYGESVITWNANDYAKYRVYRSHTDSLFYSLKISCQNFIQPEQLDTLCKILEQKERQENIDNYTDSLRIRNKELNGRLYTLITALDEQTEKAFQQKQEELQSSYERSVMTVTGLVVSAILLLAFSYLKIHRDIKEKAANKKKLEEHVVKLQQSVKENEELISNRHRIMQTITHELRTPLSVIIGYAEMAANETDTAISQDYARKALLTAYA